MKILGFLFILTAFLVHSCTIIQEYHFNKDFSGNTQLSVDMGSFMQMMAGMDSTGASTQNMKDSLDFIFTENVKKLEELGIKNVKYGWKEDSNVLFMSYDFSDIESLNSALNSSNSQNSALSKTLNNEPHTYFSRKGKTLMYKGPKSEKDVSNKDMESMADYYQYSLIFNFDRKVKKVDNPNVTISPDNKKVELSGSMFKIIRPDYNSDITFKLK
jgi:phosphoribosyl-AMP cyclohydrolase